MMGEYTGKNWLQKISLGVARSVVGATLAARVMHHLDWLALRLSAGRLSLSTLLTGLEILSLTATGARSGRPHTVPLAAIPHENDQLILIASNWGQGRHPAWYYNLLAHPEVEVRRNGRVYRYLAQETSGSQREACWQVALQIYPAFAAYKRRANRQIPVILLKPLPDSQNQFHHRQLPAYSTLLSGNQSSIRPATAVDLPTLYQLDHIARSGAERRAFIARSVREGRAWVIELAGRVCGYGVIGHEFFGRSFLEMVYIAAGSRGQGLGPQLIRFMETQSQSDTFFTSTNESNRHMQHVLEKLGYERSGIIHNLDSGDPELVYVKHLAGAGRRKNDE